MFAPPGSVRPSCTNIYIFRPIPSLFSVFFFVFFLGGGGGGERGLYFLKICLVFYPIFYLQISGSLKLSKDWKLRIKNYLSMNPRLNDKMISAQDNHRDLGVIMFWDLSWNGYPNTISKKAYLNPRSTIANHL